MELTFLGRGAALNPKEKSNACYYKNNNGVMLLIDCGESVFREIEKNNLLDGVDKLYVAITHTHSDHVGSLGSFVFFAYFNKKLKINFLLTQNQKFNMSLKTLLGLYGLQEDWFNFVAANALLSDFPEFVNFEFLPTPHVVHFDSFGLLIEHRVDGLTYYSSDTNSNQYLIKYISYKNLDKIYIDTSKNTDKNNVHLSGKIISESVPKDLRHKVHCMHIDDSNYITDLKEMGFNIVDV